MKKTICMMLALLLAVTLLLPAAAEGTAAEPAETETQVRRCLNPAMFFTAFNQYMAGMADTLSAQGTITDADADILKTSFTFSQVNTTPMVDGTDGNVLYIGNADWMMGAAFFYKDEIADPPQDAVILNMSFGAGVPEVVILLARTCLQSMVSVDYADEETKNAIAEWFSTASVNGDILALPDGYMLGITVTTDQLTYSLLPPNEMNPFAQ